MIGGADSILRTALLVKRQIPAYPNFASYLERSLPPVFSQDNLTPNATPPHKPTPRVFHI